MALTKLNGYAGEAEVLQALRRVEYSNGALTIHGMTVDESYAVLSALSTGKLETVRVKISDVPPAAEIKATAEAKPPKPTSPQRVVEKPVEKPVAKIAAVPTPPPPPKKEELSEQENEVEGAKAAAKDSTVLDFPPKEEKQAAAPPATSDGDLPEHVIKATRLIEVVEWALNTKGFTVDQGEEMAAYFETIKESVPVIRRPRDLKARVLSGLAAYKEAGGNAA